MAILFIKFAYERFLPLFLASVVIPYVNIINIIVCNQPQMHDENPPKSGRADPDYVRQLLDQMEPDAAAACLKVIDWMAERPRNAPTPSHEEMMQMVEETRLEIIRRRLGGVVGQVIPFDRNKIAS